mgnify:CR=1 FL=1
MDRIAGATAQSVRTGPRDTRLDFMPAGEKNVFWPQHLSVVLEGFADPGNPSFPMVGEGLAPGIFWRGFQLESLAVSEDGRYVVMGDDEALSQLMVFKVAPR